MTLSRFVLLSACVAALAGCSSDDGPIEAPNIPIASTRYINAMPDTLGTTWRFVDQLELSPIAIGLDFREFSPYQPTEAGQRPLKVFVESTEIEHTQRTFADTTLTFDAGKRYTIVQVGMARALSTPSERMLVLDDVFPTLAANQIAVRFVHTGAGLGPIDIYAADAAGGPATPSTPLVSNLSYLGVSPYVVITAGANTGLVSLAGTATGFSRSTGSFIADGFRVGQAVAPSRFLLAPNNTRSIITGVTATELTIGPNTGSISLAAETNGFTRSTGSFLTDGFARGMRFSVTGFATAANNGAFVIDNITATKIGVTNTLTAEPEAAGRTIRKANQAEAESPGRIIQAELVFRATVAGTSTLVAELTAPPGAPAEPGEQLTAIGGTSIPGSILSAFLMPSSVAGSSAASYTTPSFVYLVDKHPR